MTLKKRFVNTVYFIYRKYLYLRYLGDNTKISNRLYKDIMDRIVGNKSADKIKKYKQDQVINKPNPEYGCNFSGCTFSFEDFIKLDLSKNNKL